jgi:hypothetical protein
MNCRDYQNWLQSDFDGGAGIAPGSPEHRASCPDCASLEAAARRLRQGLRLLTVPAVPAGLTGRVVAGVLADRRRRHRFRRRFLGVLALAASVLLIALSPLWPRPLPVRETTNRPLQAHKDAAPTPSLRERVAAMAPAVAGLTTRALDWAVDDTRVLLPVVDRSLLPSFEAPMPEPANPLRDSGDGMTAALEPLADTARRAFALFRRDVPLQAAKKPEL